MSSVFSAVLIVFWISVFGMVFGNTEVSRVSHYLFYLTTPIILIYGFYEIVLNNKDG
jgi:hypothetical protein